MKIGILGAPGSGKSKFALSYAKRLREDSGQQAKVIDGYVPKLSKETGYAYGMQATYPQNLQIACLRWTLEQRAEHGQAEHLVVAGTIYETVLYAGLRVTNDIGFNERQRENLQIVQRYGRAAMQAFAMFHALTADHDLLFFLPYDAQTIVAKGRSYESVVDSKIPEVVLGYQEQLLPLDGTFKQKVDDALTLTRVLAGKQAEELAAANAETDSGSSETSAQERTED